MGELLNPSHHLGGNIILQCPLNPLISIRLANCNERNTISRMSLKHISDTIGQQVCSAKHNRTLRGIVITNPALEHQRKQYILHRLHRLTDLVEHDDYRLIRMELEPRIGGKLSHLQIFTRLNCIGQRKITQVQ